MRPAKTLGVCAMPILRCRKPSKKPAWRASTSRFTLREHTDKCSSFHDAKLRWKSSRYATRRPPKQRQTFQRFAPQIHVRVRIASGEWLMWPPTLDRRNSVKYLGSSEKPLLTLTDEYKDWALKESSLSISVLPIRSQVATKAEEFA